MKKFVELQGGEMAVESEVGKGSTFIVSLPVREKGKGGITSPNDQAPTDEARMTKSQ